MGLPLLNPLASIVKHQAYVFMPTMLSTASIINPRGCITPYTLSYPVHNFIMNLYSCLRMVDSFCILKNSSTAPYGVFATGADGTWAFLMSLVIRASAYRFFYKEGVGDHAVKVSLKTHGS